MAITIGDRFKETREKLGFKQSELARAIEVNPSIISDIERGEKEPSKKIISALIIKYRINSNWLLADEGEMFLQKEEKPFNINKFGLKQLPVYSEADLPEGAFVVPLLDQQLCAGSGSQVPEEDASSALVRVPAYLSKYGDKVAALTVDGDSMYPTLHRGDMVVCDSCGWSGEGIYALRMSGSGFVKRLTKRPGKIVIISDNPRYPPQEEPEESQDIQIIGRVHCAITKVE